MADLKRIPFDSLALAAVVCEMQPFVGSKLQRIAQVDESTIILGFYGQGHERYMLLSNDPQFGRAHLVSEPVTGISPPPPFCQAIRKSLTDSRLDLVQQVGFDRILKLRFRTSAGDWLLIAELMGKHGNLILVDSHGKVSGAAKWVGPSKSKRPILIGKEYEPPPFPAREPIWKAKTWDELKNSEGASPFLVRLVSNTDSECEAADDISETVRACVAEIEVRVRKCRFDPVESPGYGGYPISVSTLGYSESSVSSISEALEKYYARESLVSKLEAEKRGLVLQLRRVLLSREVAIRGLEEAEESAKRASQTQRMAEVLLSSPHGVPKDVAEWRTTDWEGNELLIPLDPEISPQENAARLFERAKKSKARVGEVREQLARQRSDWHDVGELLAKVETSQTVEDIEPLKGQAKARRWLIRPSIAEKEQRPFEGHRVRELVGPKGYRVLVGENATANDYLTQKVARPNDWWLHVRGAPSAHVVVLTDKKPDSVPKEVLLFAAKVAVKNSPAKHSSMVAVDYTLRKYVRKPRGSAPGTVTYEREKTVHIAAQEA